MRKAFWILLKRLAVVSILSVVLALANNNNVQAQERILGNLVVQGAKIGIFRHGTLVTKNAQGELVLAPSPSVATHTHPGVDLVANCGSPIHVIADGRVNDVIDSDKDRDFRSLGYMVLVEHEAPVNGKKTYSIYLHMKAPPKVAIGQKVKSGQSVIGEVGHTGAADGCHTHLEVRHFPSRYLEDAKWNQPWNIYGMGDQQNTERFRKNWEDPVAILSGDVKKEISRAESYYKTGNFQETINILENIRNQGISKNPEIDQLLSKAYIQYSYLQLNENKITPDEAIELNRKAYELDPMRPEASYNIACMYAKKGQVEEAINWLERSYPIITQEKYKQLLGAIKNDPDLNNLRLSPEFNIKFPKLALQTTEEASVQKSQQSMGQNLRAEQVIFALVDCRPLGGTVRGNIPQEIDLSDDTISRQILEQALKFAREKCPRAEDYDIVLCKSGEDYGIWEKGCSVEAEYDNRKLIWSKYENRAFRKRLEEEAVAAGVIRPLPGNSFLHFLGADSKSGAKFWRFSWTRSEKCEGSFGWGSIYVEVPNTISLLDDTIVRSLVIVGSEKFLNNCKTLVEEGRLEWMTVSLIPAGYKVEAMGGDPGSVISIIFSPILVEAKVERKGLKIISIKNYVIEAEQRKLKLEQEEKAMEVVRKRLNEFVAKNKVKEWVSLEKLSTNPFVYEGKTIGVVIRFYKMLSATQGVFGGGDFFGFPAIVVSDIPKGLFTSERSVVLAGRVLGNIETQLPILGKMMVPHLKFVGVHFCKDWGCSDILPKEKK